MSAKRLSLLSAVAVACSSGGPPKPPAPALVTVDSVVVDRFEPGLPGLDSAWLTMRVRNLGSAPTQVGLDLRTIPGLWAVSSSQSQWAFALGPHETRDVQVPYRFRRLTTEAVLRIQLGKPVPSADGLRLDPPLTELRLPVGHTNPAAVDLRLAFDSLSTPRFRIFAYRGSLAAAHMPAIARTRDLGAQRIERLLGTTLRQPVLLVFYPDSARKTRDTGHIGEGFASGHTIVEIYNDSVQLDPYHELAHIIAGQLGDPPAMLDEGFATYVSERLGSPALRYQGYGDRKISAAVCDLSAQGRLLPLAELLSYSDIGSEGTHADVAYPQSASMVHYLIETKGLSRFRTAYRILKRSRSMDVLRENELTIRSVFGRTVQDLESGWKGWLNC